METEMHEIKATLKRIEDSSADTVRIVKRTEQAVFGDEQIGLTGLVNDMRGLKRWRSTTMLKASAVGGVVGGAVIGLKAAVAKLFS